MIPTTETLLKGLAEGNEARWARFYRDYAPFLESFLADKFNIGHADAEDIISETLVDIARQMPTYRYDKARNGSFHSLLYKIAQNKTLDWLKKQRRESLRLEAYSAEKLALSAPSADDWRNALYAAALRRVMADPSIRESSKIAFRRVVQQGEDAQTVAAELNMEVNALYQIRSRIKNRLAEEVEKLKGEFPDAL